MEKKLNKSIEEAGKEAQLFFKTNSSGDWVKWYHEGIPDEPVWRRETVRTAEALLGHCLKCTAISGCYFINNKLKYPKHPQHENCHCLTINMNAPNAVAGRDINKFIGYIFSEKYEKNGKKNLFEHIGFSITDSQFLKNEYER